MPLPGNAALGCSWILEKNHEIHEIHENFVFFVHFVVTSMLSGSPVVRLLTSERIGISPHREGDYNTGYLSSRCGGTAERSCPSAVPNSSNPMTGWSEATFT